MDSFRKGATSLAFLFLLSTSTGTCRGEITMTNECTYEVWAAVSSVTMGLGLEPGQSVSVAVPEAWSGMVWARTFCYASNGGKLSCVTGDGDGGSPVTQVELDLEGPGGAGRYGLSLVNGFNLAVLVQPFNPTCIPTGCVADLNEACPQELQVTVAEGQAVAGCRNQHTLLSYQFFKSQCPLQNSFFTCSSTDYRIFFCPTNTRFHGNIGGNGNEEVHSFGSFVVKVIATVSVTLILAASFYIVRQFMGSGKRPGTPEIGLQMSATFP